MKTGITYRSSTLDRSLIDEEKRTVTLAFSSEKPVDRGFALEVLEHTTAALDLSRLNSGGALLSEHDTDRQIGVVEKAYIDADKVARAVVRFSRSPLGEQEFQDVKDGIRRLVSVGYRIHDWAEERNGPQLTQRVTRWEPLEISLVSVPADSSVGVGRNLKTEAPKTNMSNEPAATLQPPAAAPVADSAATRAAIINEANARASEILAIGETTNLREEAISFVREGKSADEFRKHALTKQAEQLRKFVAPVASPEIGMSEREKSQYSILRAVQAAATGDWSEAGLEREASKAIAKKVGRVARSFFVPTEAFASRELTVGVAAQGGNTVSTDYRPSEFIDLLRNRLVVSQLGARVLSGLTGPVEIPKQSGGATAYWLGESDNVTGSDQAFAKVTLSPKTVAAKSHYSRRLVMQGNPGIEGIVRSDLLATIATAIDLAALNGTGASNQPTGILNTAGITTVALGTNGAAPTRDSIIAMINALELANTDLGTMGFIGNPRVKSKLQRTTKQTSGIEGNFLLSDAGNDLMGYRALWTNQIPANLTKGSGTNLSAFIFGNYADLLIGNWGVLDMQVDPYGSADDGGIILRVFQDIDIAVRRPESFAVIKDIITT